MILHNYETTATRKKKLSNHYCRNNFIATGFILMSGGRSDDPEVFNPEIYNFRRIRLAPTLILIGLAFQALWHLVGNKKK